jgi:hypothetical protein
LALPPRGQRRFADGICATHRRTRSNGSNLNGHKKAHKQSSKSLVLFVPFCGSIGGAGVEYLGQ